MAQQPSTSSDEEKKQKYLLRRIERVIAVVAVIIIISIAAYAYLDFQGFLGTKGELRFVNFEWNDNHPLSSSPYVHVEGIIFNSGERTAGNVELTIGIYSQGTLLKTEIIDVDDIPPKTYGNFSNNIQYSGDASRIERQLKWKPYG